MHCPITLREFFGRLRKGGTSGGAHNASFQATNTRAFPHTYPDATLTLAVLRLLRLWNVGHNLLGLDGHSELQRSISRTGVVGGRNRKPEGVV